MPRYEVRVYRVGAMSQSTREAKDEATARSQAIDEARAGKARVVDPDCRFIAVAHELKDAPATPEPTRAPSPLKRRRRR